MKRIVQASAVLGGTVLSLTLLSPSVSAVQSVAAPASEATSPKGDFVTAARGSGGPKMAKLSKTRILTVGNAICKQYKREGYAAWVTNAINRGLVQGGLTKTQARGVSLAARTYLCPKKASAPESGTESAPSPTQTPAPSPTPTPTPTPTKLVLPDNSGWNITTSQFSGSQYLTSPAGVGKVLPLGNAAELGLSLYGSTCSGEWYDSAFVGVEFLDASGNALPGPYGLGKELLGYFAGKSDINSSGCGGETVAIKDWEGATAIRIVSDGGRNGSVSLFGRDYL